MILNAVDARMPYWSPCDEVQHEAEAEGLAAALFKDDPRTNPFFVMVPRQIFAHLLIEQPKRTPQELLAILRDERELAKRLKGTEHAAAIYPDAGPQRGGMIATLNSVSNALKLLPRREEAKANWTAMRYFGLPAPRSKVLLSQVFSVLKQQEGPRSMPLRCAESIYRTFGQNPLMGLDGQPLLRVGHVNPLAPV